MNFCISAPDAAYVSDGLRDLWQRSPAWEFAGTTGPPPELAPAMYERRVVDGLRTYDVPIGESSPAVQMLGAAVRMSSAHKVPVLVVVTPIPWQSLERNGLYRRETVAARVAAIRNVVQANGGVLLDLHRFVGEDGFRDQSGHFNRTGSARMVEAVTPALIDLVAPPPAATPRHPTTAP